MTRKSLGDKFREAAGMIADGACHSASEAMICAKVDIAVRMAFYEMYPLGHDDRDHRVIALLTCACMADTGDLK